MPGGVSPFSIAFSARSSRCRAMMMPLSVETRFSLVRSMIGPMLSCSEANLVSTDNGIIMARHRQVFLGAVDDRTHALLQRGVLHRDAEHAAECAAFLLRL